MRATDGDVRARRNRHGVLGVLGMLAAIVLFCTWDPIGMLTGLVGVIFSSTHLVQFFDERRLLKVREALRKMI